MTAAFQDALGHGFAQSDLLREALTHRSAAGRGGQGSNERLEFVGDRVLGLVIAEWLAERFPAEQEGQLGPRLAHLVSRVFLAKIADDIGLGQELEVATGEARAGVTHRATVVADALEAVIGALYLDGGLAVARGFIRRHWAAYMEAQSKPPKDPKTALQEFTLARGWGLPSYHEMGRSGPPHAPVFRIEAAVQVHRSEGEGTTKRLAERQAASALLALLEVK